jgi:hypothetical protein
MKIFENKLLSTVLTLFLIFVFLAIFYFDKALLAGLIFVGILIAFTFLTLKKYNLLNKQVSIIFWFAFLTHFSLALLMYYLNFHPLGQGDFILYQEIAEKVFQRIRSGIFYLDGLNYLHYYPVLIGAIYSLTMPKMIIGQIFSAWLAGISVLFAYFLMVEIGSSKKTAFLVSAIICFYPSFIYFGSLMLKDTVVLPLVLFGLLLSVRMFKNYSPLKFFAFFIILTFIIHLRFYIGFALMFSFIFCWFLISNLKIKKRIVYGFIFIFILGFCPYIIGYGYYGSVPLKGYLNKKTITTYREIVYAPNPSVVSNAEGVLTSSSGSGYSYSSGVESSFVIKTGLEESNAKFIKNYFVSFVCAFLGPFPWQLKTSKHLLFLIETIPWYFLLCLILWGIFKSFKTTGFFLTVSHYRFSLILLLFSAIALGALSLFINNFGIIVRIRIPAVISLLCLLGLDKNIDNIINKLTNYLYEKKFVKFFSLSGLRRKS